MVDEAGNVSEQPKATGQPKGPEQQSERIGSQLGYGDRILAMSGYFLILAAVVSFGAIAFVKVLASHGPAATNRYESWLDLAQHESSTLSLLLIGIVSASLGKRLLTSVRLADARTIPYEDLPLIRQAVIDGKPEPIDQYVRLRSLSGMSGNFTKMGITGLPLTTVLLTLVFSLISLMPLERANSFLDLAKLTLGAFIGSFVQRQVEQRRQEGTQQPGTGSRPPSLPSLPV